MREDFGFVRTEARRLVHREDALLRLARIRRRRLRRTALWLVPAAIAFAAVPGRTLVSLATAS